MVAASKLSLSENQRSELSAIALSQSLPSAYVFRAKLILMLAEGAFFRTIQQRLQTTAPTIIHWKQRFLAFGLDGLDTYHPGRTPTVLTPALRARIRSATRKKLNDDSKNINCCELAAVFGVSPRNVRRALNELGLKPYRLERYMASDDLECESKASDIIGLYLRQPQHAAVFYIGDKTDNQVPHWQDHASPFSQGRRGYSGLEHYQSGTLSLYQALAFRSCKMNGKTTERHTNRKFAAFLKEAVSLCPPTLQIHIVLDNLSAHKTEFVREFLEQNPRVRFHFTSTYSSWLKRVGTWFAKIERDVIARDTLETVPDLARTLRRYINAYSANAKPIQWKYADVVRYLRSSEHTATGHEQGSRVHSCL